MFELGHINSYAQERSDNQGTERKRPEKWRNSNCGGSKALAALVFSASDKLCTYRRV